ncbi:DNA cytosine methyltransferase [Agrobacterium salinitolerans]|uniref:DNA cytosine methyltransferase n=1 Tax=Agrobacterium salinitolerans TaxID=1183413 RepID=UPI0022B81F36|nr:DNA cytosine methyltransferase [Agrobacterium salinitolerans]MCZ7855027.1 DNA cytosine methyltransferase [Agrobacterium salinitolerans]
MNHANDNGKPITFISMFSGIEAASVAFGPLGWKAICFAEIEKFPSAVLAHHYPDVPNVGDMSKHDWAQYRGKVDIVCGGPPCQDFSIAGLRAGLDGERGNLSIVYMRALHAIKPRNAIVENVPGWLNDKKNAFGCFLAGLVGADDPLRTPDGKSWPNAGMVAGPLGRAAWRVLDAQYFGLAQRRRRVIVVADFGNGADPAAVLFERKGLFGNTPPSREAGKDVAGSTAKGAGSGGLIGGIDYENNAHGPDEPTGPLLKGSPSGGGRPLPAIAYTPEIARCVATREGSSQDYETTTMVAVAGTLCKDSFSGGMGGRPEGAAAGHLVAHAIQAGALRENPNSGPDGVGVQEGLAYTLEARAEVQAISYGISNQPTPKFGEEISPSLDAKQSGGGRMEAVSYGSAVRRLTPVECERLQGFPDGYTDIPWRGKPNSPDGPRYKALGNSWAVPKFVWLGKRIQQFMPANDNNKLKDAA